METKTVVNKYYNLGINEKIDFTLKSYPIKKKRYSGYYQNQKHTLKGLHQGIFSNYISDKNIIIQKYNKNSRSNQKVKKQIIFN